MLLNSFKKAELQIDFTGWLLKVKKDEVLHFDGLIKKIRLVSNFMTSQPG